VLKNKDIEKKGINDFVTYVDKTSEEEEALFGARIGKQYSFVKKDLLSPAIFSIISEVKNSGKPAHQIINLFYKQEYNFWCDVFITPEDSHRLLLFYKNVTEIYKLVQVLEKNKKELRQLQDNVPIGLYKSTPDGQLLYINNWFAKILGYNSTEELINKNVKDFCVDKKQRRRFLDSLMDSRKDERIEVQMKRKDNNTIWVVISATAVFNGSNKANSYDGYIFDITERKKAIDKLKDSEEMFRAISQNIRSLIYVFDEKGDFIYANPAVADVTGYSRNEILGTKFYDLIHPDNKELVKEREFRRVLGGDVPRNYEFQIVKKDGEQRWIEIFSTRILLKGRYVAVGLANDVTDRKKALESIKTSEEKYKTLYSFFRLMADNVPDMIWAKNLSKEYIFANRSVCTNLLNARNTDEPVGKPDEFFINREKITHPAEPDWFSFGENHPDSDEIVMETKKAYRYDEYGNMRGKYLHLDVQKSPLWDNEGKMIGVVGSARDVTIQRKMEQNQHRQELIKSVVYKISNAVNTTKDLNELFTVIRLELNRIIDTTNLYIALYDRERGMLTMPYFIDEKDRFTEIPSKKTLTSYLIKHNKPLLLNLENIYDLIDKKEIEMVGTPAKVWLGVPLRIKNETIGAIVIQNYKDENAFDNNDLELLKFVSVQIITSISQKMADDSLRESEFALRQIIDNVPVMIFAKDKNLKYVLANKEFANTYHLRVDEIEGRLQSDIHSDKEEIDKYLNDDYSVLDKGKIKVIDEERFTNLKGETRIFRTIKIPFKTVTSKGIALLGVAMDITDRKNVEFELKKAKEKAEEADRLKTAFLANMSHEIRTPMNAIIGFSELLNDPDLTIENRKDFIKLIGDNSKVLLHLIEDIIDVAKIEAEQITIVNTTCQVNLILDELAEYFQNQLKNLDYKKISISLNKEVNDSSFSIITDPLRFKQIMTNLVGNAVKFTEKGSIEFGYKIAENKQIIFYVKDTGIGLANGKLKVIFERFRQAEESSTKEYGGTGLGLTISRRLVELLGGTIWVESVINEGSNFYFSLPLKLAKPRYSKEQTEKIAIENDWTGKTILVAEDEKSNFELIKATLLKTNAEIIWARNGLEAVNIYKNNIHVNLILMDMRMPEMNGYEATEIIKKSRKDLPVVSLTAYAMTEDKEKSIKAGCDEYISKPFIPAELIKKISKYLK